MDGEKGYNQNNQTMGLNDWLKVANSTGAIGATIDRKRQEQRQNTEEDRQKLIDTQAAEAFNYFSQNPEAIDAIDNPEKQTVKQSAIGDIAGVPAQRPRMPIEDFAPEAIAKARVASMSYLANKKALSRESLMQLQAKAKLNRTEFMKGLSLSATTLANGDKETATKNFVDTYNKYYPDGHKIKIADNGDFLMVSPTGVEKNIGQPEIEKMIDGFLKSPELTDNMFAKSMLTASIARRKMNEEAWNKPTSFFDKDGKEYFSYQQLDPETGDHKTLVMNLPVGTPWAKTLTASQIRALDLKTKDSIEFNTKMATEATRQDYYKNGGKSKTATDKTAVNASKNYAAIVKAVMGDQMFTGADDDEIKEEAERRWKLSYPNEELPGAAEAQQRKYEEYMGQVRGGAVGAVGQMDTKPPVGATGAINAKQPAPAGIPTPESAKLPPPAQYKGKKAIVDGPDGKEIAIHSDGVNWINSETGEILAEDGRRLWESNRVKISRPPTPAVQSATQSALSQQNGRKEIY